MMMDRSVNAWSSVPHVDCEREWKEVGCLNALDGSEDHLLTEDLKALWCELQISSYRDQIREDIATEVAAGILTSWWQYPSLLESYDEHRPLREGEEMANVFICPDDDDDDDDGDGDDGDGDG